MYVADAVDLVGSPFDFWRWAGNERGADLRVVGMSLAEGGPLRRLLRFAHPYEDRGQPIGFDIEVRPDARPVGTIFLRWEAHFSRFEGELEVIPAGPGLSHLRLTASYEPAWAASLKDRRTLAGLARDAARTVLEQVAAATPTVTSPPDGPVLQPATGVSKHRVLIEDEDPTWHEFLVHMADADEYEFASCRGPFLADGGCPVLRGEPCPKVEWADTVLHSLDPRQPANGAVIDAIRRRYPDFAPTMLGGEPATFCLTRVTKARAGL
ncbi:MAG: hypothetical protein AB1679_01295 [Actinomycetota bacterium]|jgi:hypothetical protein